MRTSQAQSVVRLLRLLTCDLRRRWGRELEPVGWGSLVETGPGVEVERSQRWVFIPLGLFALSRVFSTLWLVLGAQHQMALPEGIWLFDFERGPGVHAALLTVAASRIRAR